MKVLFEFNNGRRKRVNQRDAKALELLGKGQVVEEQHQDKTPQETQAEQHSTTAQTKHTKKPRKKKRTYKRRDMSAE